MLHIYIISIVTLHNSSNLQTIVLWPTFLVVVSFSGVQFKVFDVDAYVYVRVRGHQGYHAVEVTFVVGRVAERCECDGGTGVR